MIGAVAQCLGEKRAGFLLLLLALEGILLFFQWTLAGYIESDSLQLRHTQEEVFRKSNEHSYKKGFLARCEAGLAELEQGLSQNVEVVSEATAFVDGCLKSSGIAADVAATCIGEANIVITVEGECLYIGLISFLGRLSSIPYTARMSEMLVERRGEQWVHFVVKINFASIRTYSGVDQIEIK